MAATLTQVAKRAGVSLSTASRAYSDPDRLGPETLRKILAAAQELGYEAPAARLVEPPAHESRMVGVVVPDVANPVFGAFVKAAQGEGWHYGQTVVLVDTDFSAEREREAILRLRDRVDGLVVCSPRLDADTVLELCGRVPSVLVNREAAGADCIVADASDGLRQAVDYLGALGHRRIAYVQGSARSWSNAQRVALVEELAGKAGIGVQVLGSQDETVEGGTAAAASVIACGASAVIAHNDLVALGVVAGARALGVQVPHDLSVIGIDNIPLATASAPPLTTISVPMARAGALALATLRRAAGQERPTPRTVRLSTQLVVRASTGPAADRSARTASIAQELA
ncbi:MAG TPA: LacI family DNA-binding transcriptional regulator [Pseudonocardia sp.]|jgi:LacI family transcriptional regulator, galactose operon repressor|nr:LacI family DNA-binding transcriptional regulator [Pseudonocardia sp.]